MLRKVQALSSKRVVHYSIFTKCLAVGPEDNPLLFGGQRIFETDCRVANMVRYLLCIDHYRTTL